MAGNIFHSLACCEDWLWSYIGFPVIMFLGFYLSYQSRFAQIRRFPHVLKTFVSFFSVKHEEGGAVHPLKAFFASIGGTLGIGNIVAACTAVQIGGPGALFWMWLAAILGVMLKYGEVFLGIKYRVSNGHGGYNGGPMYFLRHAFRSAWPATVVALLLCVYGVEIYQFNVVTDSVAQNSGVSEIYIVLALLGLVLFAGGGGVERVGAIASAVIPFFVLLYAGMGGWVILHHLPELPALFTMVFKSAFTGYAALGGFAGATWLMAASQGISRAIYTGDIGIGYASVLYSESSEQNFARQASLVIFGIFIDTFIVCTTSLMLVLVTGVWKESIDASMLVQTALSQYFPHMQFFMPFFLFLLGYTTINAYFVTGLKCADYLIPKWGKPFYTAYAITAFLLFSFFDQTAAQTVMMITAGLLVLINSLGIWLLRKEISYNI